VSTTPDATLCLTCDLVRRRDRGEAPLWDSIHRTAHWDVVHSYNTSLPGWLVLAAQRHITAIDERTDEAAELGVLLRRTSAAARGDRLRNICCQFAEQANTPIASDHPRLADQLDARRGPRVFG
jgi:diadenosine tetraphosphate (Ap4A) HIT family hydrolase